MSTDSTDRLTIDEAFQILLPSTKPHAAKMQLNAAIIAGEVTLWVDAVVVDPDLFERHLRVGATETADGQWNAYLHMLSAVDDWLPPETAAKAIASGIFNTTAAWTMSRAEVTGLLAGTRPPGRQRGRKQIFDWDLLVAELLRKMHVEGIPAEASDLGLAEYLVAWCGKQNFTEIPGIDTVRKKLAVWLSLYRQEN
jgi:hypothetical protein